MLGILVSFWDEFSGAILVLGSVLLGNLPTENMYCNKRTISVFFAHSLAVALWLFRYVLVYTSIHLDDFPAALHEKTAMFQQTEPWCVRFPEEVQRDEQGFLNVRDAQQGLGGLNHPNIKAKTPRVLFIGRWAKLECIFMRVYIHRYYVICTTFFQASTSTARFRIEQE